MPRRTPMRRVQSARIARSISVSARQTKTQYIRDNKGLYISTKPSNALTLRELQGNDKSFIFTVELYKGIERNSNSPYYGKNTFAVTFKTVLGQMLFLGHIDEEVTLISAKVNQGHIILEKDSHNLFHPITDSDYVTLELSNPELAGLYLASDGKSLFVKRVTDASQDEQIRFYLEPTDVSDSSLGIFKSCFSWFRNIFKSSKKNTDSAQDFDEIYRPTGSNSDLDN